MGGVPSSVIKSGGTLSGGNSTQSKSMAGQSQFNTHATTGAMGPSSRSPLVWVGALLSLCVLVLAGAILWSRSDQGSQASKPARPTERVAGNPVPKPPQPVVPPVAVQPAPVPVGTPEPIAATAPVVRPDPTPAIVREPSNQVSRPSRPPVVKPPKIPDRIAQPSKPPEPDNQTGFVLIKSAPPFAALTINGKPQGETPMNAYLEVPVGKCHIEIVHRLSPPFDTVLNVTPGFRREYKFKLDR